MTTANKVTVLRILLVPFFVFLLVSYGDSVIEGQRWAAMGCFALAALLDGVDGFIARRFHQKSELGAVLAEMVMGIVVGGIFAVLRP